MAPASLSRGPLATPSPPLTPVASRRAFVASRCCPWALCGGPGAATSSSLTPPRRVGKKKVSIRQQKLLDDFCCERLAPFFCLWLRPRSPPNKVSPAYPYTLRSEKRCKGSPCGLHPCPFSATREREPSRAMSCVGRLNKARPHCGRAASAAATLLCLSSCSECRVASGEAVDFRPQTGHSPRRGPSVPALAAEKANAYGV